MRILIGPLDGDWSRWGSPLDRKRDTLAYVQQARGLPMDEASIRAMDAAMVDRALAALRVTVWTSGGLGHVGR